MVLSGGRVGVEALGKHLLPRGWRGEYPQKTSFTTYWKLSIDQNFSQKIALLTSFPLPALQHSPSSTGSVLGSTEEHVRGEKSTHDQNLATEVEINLIKSPATPPSQWEALASCASAKIPWWGIFFKRLLLLESIPDIWLDAIWYGFRQTGCAMCAYHSEGRLVSKPAADSCIPITWFGGNDYVLLTKGLRFGGND